MPLQMPLEKVTRTRHTRVEEGNSKYHESITIHINSELSSHNLTYIDQASIYSKTKHGRLHRKLDQLSNTKAAIFRTHTLWSKEGIHHMADKQHHASKVFSDQEQEGVICDEILRHRE